MGILDVNVNNKIVVNLVPGVRPPRLHCSQYDAGREITITVFNGDDPYDVTDCYMTIEGSKPDGTSYSYSVMSELIGSVDGNVVTATIDANMVNVAGDSKCELVIYNDGGRIGSANIILVVEESPVNGSSTDSKTDFSGLVSTMTELISSSNELKTSADNLTSKVASAADKLAEYTLSDDTLYITLMQGLT